jgi:hypothetical protein
MGIGDFSDGVKIKTREGGMWPGFIKFLQLSALKDMSLGE